MMSRLEMVRGISRAEMELHFLRAEWCYIRPGYAPAEAARIDRCLDRPDLTDAHENRLRLEALMTKRDEIFAEVPDELEWFIVMVTPLAFGELRVFCYRDWNIFEPARTVAEVATVFDSIVVAGPEAASLEKKRRKIAAIRATGGARRDLLIAIGPDADAPLTLLDGNHRAVAVMVPPVSEELIPSRIIAGYAPSVRGCRWYRT